MDLEEEIPVTLTALGAETIDLETINAIHPHTFRAGGVTVKILQTDGFLLGFQFNRSGRNRGDVTLDFSGRIPHVTSSDAEEEPLFSVHLS